MVTFFYLLVLSSIFCVGLGQSKLRYGFFVFLHTGSANSVTDSDLEDKGQKESVFSQNSTDPSSEVFKMYESPSNLFLNICFNAVVREMYGEEST